MARQSRQTQPVDTKIGLLTDYSEVDRLLTEGEVRGRSWIHEQAKARANATPNDGDVFELHAVMFGTVYDWAGTARIEDLGPGGIVRVPYWRVREELLNLARNLEAWVGNLDGGDLAAVARVVADFHHGFQWIHPFRDTNGRTGRVLDHLLLWQTFGLAGDTFATSPTLEHFPDDAHENAYYDGLADADNHRPDHLRHYYAERIAVAVDTLRSV